MLITATYTYTTDYDGCEGFIIQHRENVYDAVISGTLLAHDMLEHDPSVVTIDTVLDEVAAIACSYQWRADHLLDTKIDKDGNFANGLRDLAEQYMLEHNNVIPMVDPQECVVNLDQARALLSEDYNTSQVDALIRLFTPWINKGYRHAASIDDFDGMYEAVTNLINLHTYEYKSKESFTITVDTVSRTVRLH